MLVLGAAAYVFASDVIPAVPGTLNYVEGQAAFGTQTLNDNSVGSAEFKTGQLLKTGRGGVAPGLIRHKLGCRPVG